MTHPVRRLMSALPRPSHLTLMSCELKVHCAPNMSNLERGNGLSNKPVLPCLPPSTAANTGKTLKLTQLEMPARNVTQHRTTSRNDFCRDRPLAKLLKRRTLAVDATCTMRNGWLRERLPAVRTYSQLVCVTNAIFLCMYVGIQP